MTIIDLNCDLGEGFGAWEMGNDAAMIDLATSVNIACGFHAGDADIMRHTVELAKARSVSIGAHPGYRDLHGFGRRPVFMIWQIGAAIMVIVFSQLTSPYVLLIGGAVMGFFINGMLGGLGALMSELYPTAARATAQNVLFNLGRGVGGFGPFVVPILAAQYSFPIAIALLAIIYVIELVATIFLIPERKGVPLE